MINKESIISAFNSKGTLLKWIKTVNDALDDGQLASVTVVNQSETSYKLSFNFADGTAIVSGDLPILRGEKGNKGDKGDKGDTGKMYRHNLRATVSHNDLADHIDFVVVSSQSTPYVDEDLPYLSGLASSINSYGVSTGSAYTFALAFINNYTGAIYVFNDPEVDGGLGTLAFTREWRDLLSVDSDYIDEV